MKEKLIPRLYRITKKQDLWVKKQAKKCGGEAEYIRGLIDSDRKNHEILGL